MFGVYQYMKLPVFQESALPLYDSPLQQISTVFAHVNYKLIARNKNELNDICATIGTIISPVFS
ncbi:hypothetical protein CON61_22785 [Bacillus toyonensis]|nr:hypothetical protein CON61_22785 [Bacillus toyonensis]PEJ61660.1 hypothetical protein CN906_24095 [Bacillus toyonensis]